MKQILIFIFLLCIVHGFCQSSDDYISEIETYRQEYKASFLKYDESPLDSADLNDLRFFDANIEYKLDCLFELIPDTSFFDMLTYSDKVKAYRKYGTIRFKVHGKEHLLTIYQNQNHLQHPTYKDFLFLPFKDETNGEETYGGGRYIDFRVSDIQNGQIIIDFNKAYNPWCAYSAGYNCPIPPKENHLSISIFAGEKEYLGTYKE